VVLMSLQRSALLHGAAVSELLRSLALADPTIIPAPVVASIIAALPAGATVLDVLCGCAVLAQSISRPPISVRVLPPFPRRRAGGGTPRCSSSHAAAAAAAAHVAEFLRGGCRPRT
jgi:hypothetical protein